MLTTMSSLNPICHDYLRTVDTNMIPPTPTTNTTHMYICEWLQRNLDIKSKNLSTDIFVIYLWLNTVSDSQDLSFALRILSIEISLPSHFTLHLIHIYQMKCADLDASEAGDLGSQKVLDVLDYHCIIAGYTKINTRASTSTTASLKELPALCVCVNSFFCIKSCSQCPIQIGLKSGDAIHLNCARIYVKEFFGQ